MRIIDAHVHLYPPEVGIDPVAWAEAQGEPHWARLCTRRRRDGRPVQTFPTADRLLREMDGQQVEKAVLLGWYWEKPATCAWQNRFFVECRKAHPDRFAVFATIHPAAGAAAVRDEIRWARDAGFCGLGELSPHSQHCRVDDPALAVALDLAAEFGLPVNFHVTDPRGSGYPGRVETPPEDFRRLARAFPQTTFILAHWGGGLPLLEADPDVRNDLANVVYDTAASPLIYDDRIWRTVLDAVPAEKVVFGSDYPLVLYPRTESEPGWRGILAEIDRAGLDAAAKTRLMGENSARLLRI
jgi:predicted TIM-barrel fold metal-dependent hydrolase